jgi:U3 small nucleolar RNA-associated protein 10
MRVQAVKEYLEVLGLAINHHPKSVIARQSAPLGDLLLRLFDLRRMQSSPPKGDSYSAGEIEEVEDGANEVAIAMIYKLNDATFRPMFSRMLEWTSLVGSNQDKETDMKAFLQRQTTWYRFLLKFFDTLKVYLQCRLYSRIKLIPRL